MKEPTVRSRVFGVGVVWSRSAIALVVAVGALGLTACGGGVADADAEPGTVTLVRTVVSKPPTDTTAMAKDAIGKHADTAAVPAGVEVSCGRVAQGNLRGRGISCSEAAELFELALRDALPAGWTCAASAVVCWEGSLADYDVATRSFSVLADACEYKGLSIDLAGVPCDFARDMLRSFLAARADGDRHAGEFRLERAGELAADDEWFCRGDEYSGGACEYEMSYRDVPWDGLGEPFEDPALAGARFAFIP